MEAFNLNNYTEEDYYATPEGARIELIDGQFYNLASPARIHQEILNILNVTIFNHIKSKGGPCKVYPAPFAVKLQSDRNTIVEPDISVICDKSKLTDRGCTGAPDWIIEIISPSTASHDYITKLNLYKETGVKEYWIVEPRSDKVFVYILEDDDAFSIETYNFNDDIKGSTFEDLSINISKLLSDNN